MGYTKPSSNILHNSEHFLKEKPLCVIHNGFLVCVVYLVYPHNP